MENITVDQLNLQIADAWDRYLLYNVLSPTGDLLKQVEVQFYNGEFTGVILEAATLDPNWNNVEGWNKIDNPLIYHAIKERAIIDYKY